MGQPFGRQIPPPQSRVHAHSPALHVHCDGRQSPVVTSQKCVAGQAFWGQPAGFGSVHSPVPLPPAPPVPPVPPVPAIPLPPLAPEAPPWSVPPELAFASPPLDAPLPPVLVPPLAPEPPSAPLPPTLVAPALEPPALVPPSATVPPSLEPPEAPPPVIPSPPVAEPAVPPSLKSSFAERPAHATIEMPPTSTIQRTMR
jgi:hypothetical protein